MLLKYSSEGIRAPGDGVDKSGYTGAMQSFPAQFQKLLPLLREAERRQLERWPKQCTIPLKIMTKADRSQVTEVDLSVHELLLSELPSLFPGSLVLSEESTAEQNQAVQGAAQLWIVDPLDGTSRFTRGEEFFGPLISFRVNGVIEFCVVSFPARGELFWAQRGEGAFLNGERIQVPQVSTLSPKSVYGEQLPDPSSPLWCARQSCTSMVQALRELLVGTRVAAVVRMVHHESYLWDVAPFSLLLAEAGAILCDERGAALRMSHPQVPCGYLVASPRSVLSAVLQLLPA